MEKKDDENPGIATEGVDTILSENPETNGIEVNKETPADDNNEVSEAEKGQHQNDEPADPADSAAATDPGTASDSGTDDSAGDTGSENGSDNPGSGENGENGEGGGKQDGDPAKDDEDPDREPPFKERFLNSGVSGEGADALAHRKESLAVSLLKMALRLLTGEIPDEKFIPLMDATLAHEAILAARAEGEIAGRNAVIEEYLATPPVGAPDLNGTPIAGSRRRASSIFDLAELAR